jgi:hypothetical protein
MKKKVLTVQLETFTMGDVNYVDHLNCKITVIEKELVNLKQCTNVLRNFLNDYECTTKEEILVYMYLLKISDMKIACIKRLKDLVRLRYNYFLHRN